MRQFFIRAYLPWSLVIIAVDVVALYGLCAYCSNADADTALMTPTGGAGVIAQDGAKHPGSRATDNVQHQVQ